MTSRDVAELADAIARAIEDPVRRIATALASEVVALERRRRKNATRLPPAWRRRMDIKGKARRRR